MITKPVSGVFKRVFTRAVMGFILTLAATTGFTQDARQGMQSYKLCAGCHGFKGQGNQLVNAPRLAGQQGWYLERQIRNFRDGVRPSDPADSYGQLMATMAQGLKAEQEIADLVDYIGQLPITRPESTLAGDADRGRKAYATCSACHGVNAEGNQMLNAPALKGLDDWYQLAQLKKFKSGQRGSSADDIYGQQMAPMAQILADEQTMTDIVVYINTIE